MHNFTYHSPTKVIFGKNTVPQIIPELQRAGVSRVVIITGGKSAYASGLHGTVSELLQKAGIAAQTVSGIQPNPRIGKVRETVAVAKKSKAEALLPIGGGSVFDSAKIAAAGALSEYDSWEIITQRRPTPEALPIFGVVTLSGTSSEINLNSVITNEETHEKLPFASEAVFPRAVIVDPTLQYSLPLQQIRHSGFDALSHVLESYFQGLETSEVISEHCESYARMLIRCLRSLPEALHDYATRADLAFCATYAYSGWAYIGRAARGDFSSHRIGHALGGMFDIPHGVTLGIIMPNWMQYVYDQGLSHDVFARFASRIMGVTGPPGGDLARAGIEALKSLVSSLGMPTSMREVGITTGDIPALAENASKSLPYGCVVPMNLETITAVLKQAL